MRFYNFKISYRYIKKENKTKNNKIIISKCQNFKISKFQKFKKFKNFKISKFQKIQNFKISKFQNFKNFKNIKISKISKISKYMIIINSQNKNVVQQLNRICKVCKIEI